MMAPSLRLRLCLLSVSVCLLPVAAWYLAVPRGCPMAPLRSKINKTFHRINDRMKRHRATNDGNASHSKQPRTLGTDEPPQAQPSMHTQSLGEPTPPGKPCSPTPSLPPSGYGFSDASSSSTQHHQNRGLDDFTTPSTASSMSLEYTHQAPAASQSMGLALGTSGSPIGMYAPQPCISIPGKTSGRSEQ